MREHETKEYNWEQDQDLQEETYIEYQEGATNYAPSQIPEDKPHRKRKKRKKKRYLLKFFLLLLLCVGLYLFLHSSLFNIKTIRVPESNHFTAAQIQELAGLKVGINLFELKAGDCEDKLRANPYIKEADIKRKLPGTVEIELVERQEMAVVARDKEFVIIDGGGTVLQIAGKMPQLTQLTGLTVASAEEGGGIEIKEKVAFRKTLEIISTMKTSDLYFKRIDVSQVVVKAYVTDTLLCRGKPQNLIAAMKDGNLKTVLHNLDKEGSKKGMINIGDDQYCSFKETK